MSRKESISILLEFLGTLLELLDFLDVILWFGLKEGLYLKHKSTF